MNIIPARIGPAGDRYEGEEPASILGIDEAQVRACGPVHYDLTVRTVSEQLIVSGRLWSEVEFACSRCAEFFRCTVDVPDFSVVLEYGDLTEVVDLTPDIREATILAFPARAVCKPDCVGLKSSWGEDPGDEPPQGGESGRKGPWGALDALELE